MAGFNVQETVAGQALTIACSAVGKHWARDFPVCVDHGLWGSKASTADNMSHRPAFDRIQPGQLGIAVHGFRWQDQVQPPRNARGSTCGPRVPLEDFMRAQFSEFALFEVEGPAYESTTKVWSDREPDAWNLRVPLNVYAHEKNVELRMDEINPAVAEAIRKSGIFASMPWVIAPATLEIPGSIGAARRLTTDGSTDVLGHAVNRREASPMRKALLSGRTIARCAFCERECVAEDLEATHLKSRCLCEEHERLDTNVAVLACVTCHHCFDAGTIYVDSTGMIRTTEAAGSSQWRREMLTDLDGRPFSCFGPANKPFLAWHQREVAKAIDAPLHLSTI